jgi:sulfonate transport system permease protein
MSQGIETLPRVLPLAPKWRGLNLRRLRGAVVPVLVLVLWQFVSARGFISNLVLPSPGQVLLALQALAVSGLLASSVAISLQRLIIGYVIGIAIGLPLGVLLAASPLARKIIAPSFYAIARVPLLAWVPFLMVIFGIGEALKLAIIAKAALTPVTMNTQRAMTAIPQGWMELSRLYRLSWFTTLRRILLPATILPVFVGLRFGLIQAWSALVVVELLAASRGLGYQLTMSRQLFQLDTMMALMLVIGIIGFILDRGVAFTESRLASRFGGVV